MSHLEQFLERLRAEPARHTDREIALRAGSELRSASIDELRQFRTVLARSVDALGDDYRKGYRHALADVLDGFEIASRAQADEDLSAGSPALTASLQRAVARRLRQAPAQVGEIARDLGKDLSSISRCLTTLRTRGLVEQWAPPPSPSSDGRVRMHRLSLAGRKALARAESAIATEPTVETTEAAAREGDLVIEPESLVAAAAEPAASVLPIDESVLPPPVSVAADGSIPDRDEGDRASFDDWALRIEELQAAGQWEELSKALQDRADLEITRGSSSSAVAFLKRAAEIEDSKRQRFAEAIALLKRARGLRPEDHDLAIALADAYVTTRDYARARDVLERAIASFGGQRTRRLVPFYQRLAHALAATGDLAEALQQIALARSLDSSSPQVLFDTAVLALEAHDRSRAKQTFHELLRRGVEPELKAKVFHYLGRISRQEGDEPRARQLSALEQKTLPSAGRAGSLQVAERTVT